MGVAWLGMPLTIALNGGMFGFVAVSVLGGTEPETDPVTVPGADPATVPGTTGAEVAPDDDAELGTETDGDDGDDEAAATNTAD